MSEELKDIPALLRSAIVSLERYDALSRPAMLQLASHLRGVLEIPHEAEEAVRQCASLDENGYIAYKSTVIAALRATQVHTPSPSSATGKEGGAWVEVKGVMIRDSDAVCTACRWKGGHAHDCERRDEPWPMIEVTGLPPPVEADPVSWETRYMAGNNQWGPWEKTTQIGAERWRCDPSFKNGRREVRELFTHPPRAVEISEGWLRREETIFEEDEVWHLFNSETGDFLTAQVQRDPPRWITLDGPDYHFEWPSHVMLALPPAALKPEGK